MDNEILKTMKTENRVRIHQLWIKAKTGDYEDVTDEEIQSMKIMLEHEDEYSEIFENAHLLKAIFEEDKDIVFFVSQFRSKAASS